MSSKVKNRRIKLSFALAALFISQTISSVAQAESPPPIFGDVTIGRKFTPDPLTVRGMSGGSVPVNNIAGRNETATGPCTGFADEKPDHNLHLTSKFDYLRLQVQSPEDTTLVISGPGGVWCNDDFEGKNAGIVGEWLAGTYKVWIGSYRKDKYLPYTLQITETK
jgi:hypothetical protein